MGAAHRAGAAPRSRANAKGYVRGFDVRTGKRLWIFHTIPLAWRSSATTPGRGIRRPTPAMPACGRRSRWTRRSASPTCRSSCPTGDYYGGHRPGRGLFGESVVAVDLHTGQRKWHFQLIHHGVWDYDIPCAPILADISVDGRADQGAGAAEQAGLSLRASIARTASRCGRSKSGRCRSPTCPARSTSPTQPFPTKPAPFERAGFLPDYLIDFTPELKAEGLKIASRLQMGPGVHAADSRGRERQGRACCSSPTARTGRAARTIPRPASSTSTRTR